MPPKPAMIAEISKSESYTQNCLDDPNFPQEQLTLKQKVLADFSLIRLLLDRECTNAEKTKKIMLLVRELAMAVSTVGDVHDTEKLESEEQRIRDEIRMLFEL